MIEEVPVNRSTPNLTLQDHMVLEHFKHLCEQTRHFNNKISDSFSLFTKLYALLVGAVGFAALDKDMCVTTARLLLIASDFIGVLIGVVAFVSITENLGAWWGYREAQHKALALVPEPEAWGSRSLEEALKWIVVAASLSFLALNPMWTKIGP